MGAALSYPASWFTSASAEGPAAGQATARILVEVGLVRTPREQRILDAVLPASLGALPFPHADRHTLVTLTLLCTAWAFYDDAIEATGQPVPEVSEALRNGAAVADSDPIVRAFARAGERLGARSAAWRARFSDAFDATVGTVTEEADLRAALARTGRAPSVARYLAWRRPNIGLGAMLSLVEHSLDVELADEVRADGLLASFVDACTDVFLAINDHCSALKDGIGGLNLAASIARTEGLSAHEAQRALRAFHDASVGRATRAATALRERYAEDEALLSWVDGAQHLLTGFAAWHAMAPRYRLLPTRA